MDFMIDSDAFAQASSVLTAKCQELENLRSNIEASFEQLKQDWDSDAGKAFFARFENDLLKNLEYHAKVFEHMSGNLTAASQKYEEVFRAADAVAEVQY
ncbi:MAG: hypothetical protein HFH89_06465 [Lachnospiraceae bacterium]|nr:WXG100 family type VII secretion target [uncultured Acetatifactor sp.]MCI8287288.1 hypothetical protein [Lachnospiraceae bacterium]